MWPGRSGIPPPKSLSELYSPEARSAQEGVDKAYPLIHTEVLMAPANTKVPLNLTEKRIGWSAASSSCSRKSSSGHPSLPAPSISVYYSQLSALPIGPKPSPWTPGAALPSRSLLSPFPWWWWGYNAIYLFLNCGKIQLKRWLSE